MTNANDSAFVTSGLTKLEHFSAIAMQGLCANNLSPMVHITTTDIEIVAQISVQCAKALIEELNKRQ